MIQTLDSMEHWRIVMRGHAGANMVPVVAANRIGLETTDGVSMTFYGSSFIADHLGSSSRSRRIAASEQVLVHRTSISMNVPRVPAKLGMLPGSPAPDLYGVIYNADKARDLIGTIPANSLDMVLKKDIATKFERCGISILDSWQDILPLVARYLGQAQLSAEPAQLGAVLAKLQEIRPFLRRIATGGYYEQLADGDLCLAIGYSGDAMIARRMAKEGSTNVRVDFAFPAGAVPLYVDSMVIPADSPNSAGALRFINFMMRPEISAEVTRFIGFASGNGAALPFLEPSVRDNGIIYPPAAVRARFDTGRVYSADEMRIFTRAWQRFSSGQ
jgi:spermidine/putrescine-binding protein